jgi:pseudaminic acid biosynthesis-associated methylase
MTSYQTEQEAFWLGEFGKSYKDRNQGKKFVVRKTAFFSRALRGVADLTSVCEFGCNIGLNLQALYNLTDAKLSGVEINPDAAVEAKALGVADIETGAIIEDLSHLGRFDLTFTMGVLIHINPDYFNVVYKNLVETSNKYVLVSEYYSPTPVEVNYRGHDGRLFKRDFAGELMEQYPLELVDYGFIYHRDNHVPMDDFTWFLMRKVTA